VTTLLDLISGASTLRDLVRFRNAIAWDVSRFLLQRSRCLFRKDVEK